LPTSVESGKTKPHLDRGGGVGGGTSFVPPSELSGVVYGGSNLLPTPRLLFEMGKFLGQRIPSGDISFARPYDLREKIFVSEDYGYDNPVIYADPSGHFPEFCQSMPTKATYELCVLAYYSLEPISYYELGMRVSGKQGCYKGPTDYRAPGYIEGIGVFQPDPLIVQEWSGNEVVYDFAKMQRASFSYKGSGISNLWLGGGISLYVGGVMGFRTDKDIVRDYGGPFRVAQLGVSLSLIVGVGTGITGFKSLGDPLVRGNTSYIGGSIGVGNILKFFKIIDAGYSPALEYTVLDFSTNYYEVWEINGSSGERKPIIEFTNTPFQINGPEATVGGYEIAYDYLEDVLYVLLGDSMQLFAFKVE
jgi:hypothetical protein